MIDNLHRLICCNYIVIILSGVLSNMIVQEKIMDGTLKAFSKG